MGFESVYPPAHSDTYIKATEVYNASYQAYYATDPTKSLIGSQLGNSWKASSPTNQRFHIDLGTTKKIKRIYYENYHESGTYTSDGAKAFSVYGSNEASAFADLDFTHDTNWTLITSDLQFDRHADSDVPDPKYIEITNNGDYRYYCIKIATNWGTSRLGLRRIELQIDTTTSISEDISVSTVFDGTIETISEDISVSTVFDGTIETSTLPMYSEDISVSTAFEAIYSLSINESINIGDVSISQILNSTINITLTDVLFIWDKLEHGWSVTNEESLVLTDSTSEVLGLMVHDWLTLIDSQTNNWNGRDIVNDTLNIYDIVEKYFNVVASINEAITLTDTNSYALTITVLEYLGFSDLANAMRTSVMSLDESLGLSDFSYHAWQMIIQETLSAVDAVSVVATFINVIQESLNASDTASLISRIGISLDEALSLTETISSKGTFYTVVYDTISMNVTVELDDEVYECYVLNTPKFHPSMYSGFNFNSYCVFENRAFGANDTGIYELTGATDAGDTIHDGVILNETDFGLPNQKRFRKGYLGISGVSPVMVFECDDGSRQIYNIDTKGMVVASHEQKSRNWKLSIADFDTLDVIKLIPVILSK
jgi:hypothetical protein